MAAGADLVSPIVLHYLRNNELPSIMIERL